MALVDDTARESIDFLDHFSDLPDLGQLANGTPDHDRRGEVFAALDPEPFQECFIAWVALLSGTPADVIAIGGKTSRRSCQKKGTMHPIHMVSTFADGLRLVPGQVKVAVD